MPEFDAIIIAGGRATRLGGIDKTALLFDGRTLLQCALDAVRKAKRISVVGFGIDLERAEGISQTEEKPRWGGPAAALGAGVRDLRHSRAELTVVIAADMPRVAGAVALLLDAIDDDHDGVIAVDSTGRRQHLLGVYRTSALRQAVAVAGSANAAMREVTGAMLLRELAIPDELCADVDTPIDAIENGIELRAHASAG
ncbi:MAG: NTP transferase domain-containing protein [Pseudolysinimonas sp.]